MGLSPPQVSPTLAIGDTFSVASQAAMLALSGAEKGDIAIRTDLGSAPFILAGSGDPSVLANWINLDIGMIPKPVGWPDATKVLAGDGSLLPAVWAYVGPKTADYTANPYELVRCDPTGGAFTVSLPDAPAHGTRVAVKITTSTAPNAVTVATQGVDVMNRAGGPVSKPLQVAGEAAMFEYDGTGHIWTVVGSDTPVGSLDGIYPRKSTSAGDTGKFLDAFNGSPTRVQVRSAADVSLPFGLIDGAEIAYSLVRDKFEFVPTKVIKAKQEGFDYSASGMSNYNAFMNALLRVPPNGALELPNAPIDQDFLMSALPRITRGDIFIYGAGWDSTILKRSGDYSGVFFNGQGPGVLSTFNLNADGVAGATSITVTGDISGFLPGDDVKLWSTDSFAPFSDSPAIPRGEDKVIDHINAGTGTIYFTTPLDDTYTVAAAAQLAHIGYNRGFRMADLGFCSEDPYTTAADLFRLEYYKDVWVEKVRVFDDYGHGLLFENCIRATRRHIHGSNLKDDGTKGYVTSDGMSSRNPLLLDIYGEYVRSVVDTHGPEVATVEAAGAVRGGLAVGIVGRRCSGVVDTHSNAEDYSFADIKGKGVGATSLPTVNLRGKRCVANGFTSDGQYIGAAMQYEADGSKIKNGLIMNSVSRGLSYRHAHQSEVSDLTIISPGGSAVYIEPTLTDHGTPYTRTPNYVHMHHIRAINPGQDPAERGAPGNHRDDVICIAAGMPAGGVGWRFHDIYGEYQAVPALAKTRTGHVPGYCIENLSPGSIAFTQLERVDCVGFPTMIGMYGLTNANARRTNRRRDRRPLEKRKLQVGDLATSIPRDAAMSNQSCFTPSGHLYVVSADLEAGSRVTSLAVRAGDNAFSGLTLVRLCLLRMVNPDSEGTADHHVLARTVEGVAGGQVASWTPGTDLVLPMETNYELNDEERVGVGVLPIGTGTMPQGKGGITLISNEPRTVAQSSGILSDVNVGDLISFAASYTFLFFVRVIGD